VSVESNPQVNINLIEETRKQINRLFDEVSRLAEADVSPPDFYGELLKRVLQGLAAPAGVVWIRTEQGHLQLQHQINLREVGLVEDEAGRQAHDALLRQASTQARALHVAPHSSTGPQENESPAPGNPTNYDILIAPILIDQAVAGLIEVWQSPGRNPNAVPGFLQFLQRMAHLASVYMRNHKLRNIVGQQQLWTQLEAFARQVHGSINPTEVAYLIANEGRRLIDCDRLSVGARIGRKTSIEAISGADVVEKRSNLVQLMRTLVERVIRWGEKLTYAGTHDDSLPPNVLDALDAYLAESNSKFLVVMPLKDEREEDSKRPPRSALVMECFDPSSTPEQLQARLEVVGRHATSALYNAVEHRRIPGRWFWKPVARVQEGLGGKAKAIGLSIAAGVAALAAMFVFLPYELKMESKGQLLPEDRRWVFSPVEGQVVSFAEGIEQGAQVNRGQPLVYMRDVKLALQLHEIASDIEKADSEIRAIAGQMNNSTVPQSEKARMAGERQKAMYTKVRKMRELEEIRQRTNSDETRPGIFLLKAPLAGTILNYGFREKLTNKDVRPSEPLLRIGNKDKTWEVELKIPQKHIGQVLQAFTYKGRSADKPLDVDLLLLSAPTKVFKGKLARDKIGGEAVPNTEDTNEADPVVYASVRIDGPDIAQADRIPHDMLLTGTEVHSRIRCGKRAMGYSLFYGLWEFFYEKVVFFF
jgi:hypothetical protein